MFSTTTPGWKSLILLQLLSKKERWLNSNSSHSLLIRFPTKAKSVSGKSKPGILNRLKCQRSVKTFHGITHSLSLTRSSGDVLRIMGLQPGVGCLLRRTGVSMLSSCLPNLAKYLVKWVSSWEILCYRLKLPTPSDSLALIINL